MAERQAVIIDEDRHRARDNEPGQAREDQLSAERAAENSRSREQEQSQEADQPRYDRYTGQRIDDRGRSGEQHDRGSGRGRSR